VAAFTKARELGYVQPEILDANLACGLYLLGDAVGAAISFQRCLGAPRFTAPAVLFGITDSRLFVAQLSSAADYVALMQLNAAWAELLAGNRDVAAHYLVGATAADMATRNDDTGKKYALSLEALRGKLR
jgi:hypothetical protein